MILQIKLAASQPVSSTLFGRKTD